MSDKKKQKIIRTPEYSISISYVLEKSIVERDEHGNFIDISSPETIAEGANLLWSERATKAEGLEYLLQRFYFLMFGICDSNQDFELLSASPEANNIETRIIEKSSGDFNDVAY